MCKLSVLFLLALFASHKIVLAKQSHAECSAALYKGLYQSLGGLHRQVNRLIKEDKLDRSVKPTCEFLSIAKDAALSRFHDSECKFGLDEASSVLFEKRFFSLIGGLIEEDCAAFSTVIEDDSVSFIIITSVMQNIVDLVQQNWQMYS